MKSSVTPWACAHSSIERLVGDDPLQLPILVLQRLQPSRIIHLKTTVLLFPSMQRRLRDAVLPAQLARLRARIERLQHLDDLVRRESTLSHQSSGLSPVED